ncbi:MAG: transporter substrate-binding domain-containing protein, partial [Paracoccaceae bacterium]
YSDVLRCARTAMITAFAVGTVLVVLPLIAEECKKLMSKFKLAGTETDSAVDVLAPTAYTLPTAGTPVSLAFILFVAWFNGEPLGLDQYPAVAALGVSSSFGGMNLAIPFLLDFLRLPSDYFGLFILGTVVTTNLWTALAAMHGVVLSLLAACAMAGRLNWLNLVLTGAASILLAAVLFWVVGFAFTGILPQENVGEQRLLAMQLTGEQVAVTEMADTAPLPVEARQRKRLAVIRERGRLRVGVNADRLPFVYRNDRGKLVGLDMELVHALARDLGVSLELVKVTWGDVDEGLNSGRIDLAIGGIAITPKRALNTTFTRSYVDETPGFLIRDEDRGNFTDLEGIMQLPSLKVGIMPNYFQRQIQRNLPNAEFVVVDSLMPFLRGEAMGVDAIVISAQMGSAWTLIYPDFTAVVPDGMKVTVPVGFAMPDEQLEYLSYLNNWLGVNIKTGMVANLYRHWVLGKTILERPPRWSIIRDVLHWIE